MADTTDLNFTSNMMPTVAAIARPGDTIMLGFDRSLTDFELNELAEDFSEFTEKTGVHIAFVEHVTSMVVARPDVPLVTAPDEPVPYTLSDPGEGGGCVKNGVRYNCPDDCDACAEAHRA
jgi:hypothetical protein